MNKKIFEKIQSAYRIRKSMQIITTVQAILLIALFAFIGFWAPKNGYTESLTVFSMLCAFFLTGWLAFKTWDLQNVCNSLVELCAKSEKESKKRRLAELERWLKSANLVPDIPVEVSKLQIIKFNLISTAGQRTESLKRGNFSEAEFQKKVKQTKEASAILKEFEDLLGPMDDVKEAMSAFLGLFGESLPNSQLKRLG